jgi:hypothetical protein
MSSSWRVAALAAAIQLCLPFAFAQSTFGSILGSVQDQSGAVIGSAHVTLSNVDENTSSSNASSSSGEILFVNLKPGHYEIVAEWACIGLWPAPSGPPGVARQFAVARPGQQRNR